MPNEGNLTLLNLARIASWGSNVAHLNDFSNYSSPSLVHLFSGNRISGDLESGKKIMKFKTFSVSLRTEI